MPRFDPNILIGMIQAAQGGQSQTPTPGMPQGLGSMISGVNERNPDRLNSALTGLQGFAPSWQEGQRWNMRDVMGQPSGMGGPPPGMGGGMGDARPWGGGMGNPNPGSMGQGGFGGRYGGTGGMNGLRGGGGK